MGHIQQGFRLFADSYPWDGDQLAFFLSRFDAEGKPHAIVDFVTEPIDRGMARVRPSFDMYRTDAQQLMDALWNCGLRPTQGKQSEGMTSATDRHLQDMRAIAFAKLNIDRP